MISGPFSLRLRRTLAAAAPLIAALWLSGCEYDTYPKDLAYPLRTDLIVVNAPKNETPFYPPGPGHLEEEIAAIPKLGGQVVDPTDSKKVSAAQRKPLFSALNKAFGSPRQPRVGATEGEEPEVVAQLTDLKLRDADAAKPFKSLAAGSKVYRYHCVHCHGLTGDGRGPTGPWVVPHPRDYRLGEFKFISSVNAGENTRPRRDDLMRTLHTGIEGTSMPSFAVMEERGDDLEAVVSYIIHLSIRGLVEKRLLVEIASGEDYTDEAKLDEKVHEVMKDVIQQWADSNSKTLEPTKGSYVENPSTKAQTDSIRRGYVAFSDPKGAASCIGCHTDYGRQVNFRYDDWGTLVRPMDLTKGVYRGGRRPIDLYWRIKGGIGPSGMPKTGLPTDKEIWDVVNFVQAVPYPQMLPEDVRTKVYGPVGEHPGTERAER